MKGMSAVGLFGADTAGLAWREHVNLPKGTPWGQPLSHWRAIGLPGLPHGSTQGQKQLQNLPSAIAPNVLRSPLDSPAPLPLQELPWL